MTTAVALVLLLSLMAYAVFGGADFGAGFWDLTAGGPERGARPRSLIEHSIGPVWEANHVWLIFIFVVTWTAFPEAYASITLTLFETNGTYRIFGNTSATATLSDNLEPTQVSVVAGDDNAYERVSSLTGWFNLIRGGDTNTSITVNFALGALGNALFGFIIIAALASRQPFCRICPLLSWNATGP